MVEWLLFTLLAILVQGLFALFEMACVSFNKIRLQYFVSVGNHRAMWIQYLLGRPSRLFGTTLLGVNAALQIGSECSRRFYESIHLDPDWAPVSQIVIVVIFAELVPMFTARKHPERIALFLAPLMIILAKFFTPLTWAFDNVSKLLHRAIKKSEEPSLFLSREEVVLAFQDAEKGEDEFTAITESIFQLKNMNAGGLMRQLSDAFLFPSNGTADQARTQLQKHYSPILLIYHRYTYNVISIVSSRSLLSLPDDKKVLDQGKSPWFVTRDTSILQILDQFRRNNQTIAVILEPSGQACGVLTLDQIIDTIFGRETDLIGGDTGQGHFVNRTLKGVMTLEQFNLEFKENLVGSPKTSLSEYISSHLDHQPSLGEQVRIGNYEFTVTELTMRGIKTLTVQTTEE